MSVHQNIMEYMDEHKAEIKDEIYRNIAEMLMRDRAEVVSSPEPVEKKDEYVRVSLTFRFLAIFEYHGTTFNFKDIEVRISAVELEMLEGFIGKMIPYLGGDEIPRNSIVNTICSIIVPIVEQDADRDDYQVGVLYIDKVDK